MLLFGTRVLGQDDKYAENLRFALDNFDFYGLTRTLENEYTQDFLQLVDDQLNQIAKIRKKYDTRVKDIRESTKGISDEKKLALMKELRKPLNEELEGILLPHQKKLLKVYRLYNDVYFNGLVNSILFGTLGREFELTEKETRKIKASAQAIYEDYRQEQIDAQKRAIAKLLNSYPKEKQAKLKELLEPMLDDNGLFYDNIHRAFKITEPSDEPPQ
jgi:hypothetical protein